MLLKDKRMSRLLVKRGGRFCNKRKTLLERIYLAELKNSTARYLNSNIRPSHSYDGINANDSFTKAGNDNYYTIPSGPKCSLDSDFKAEMLKLLEKQPRNSVLSINNVLNNFNFLNFSGETTGYFYIFLLGAGLLWVLYLCEKIGGKKNEQSDIPANSEAQGSKKK